MKQKTVFVCRSCGAAQPKWTGKCPECGEWNTLEEQISQPVSSQASKARAVLGDEDRTPVAIGEIDQAHYSRFLTGMPELDRVLGGGVVPGAAILVGGDPGIGKSTLLLQMCRTLQTDGEKILYASGEESKQQIRMRAQRLGVGGDGVMVLSNTNLESILDAAAQVRPRVLIIDSIQTLASDVIDSAPGSVAQVKECAFRLIRFAKSTATSIFIVGHVNKEGSIAGPKVLEHMVDAVLYFEGDKHLLYRVIRTIKNRFGPTSEIGVFEMGETGLVGVDNPSTLFLSGRPEEVSGVCVTCVTEGTRPILAEIQALVSPTPFPAPRRVSSGVDYNKLCLLLAVLDKRAHISLSTKDVYINVAGGLRLDDPAADLAVALSVAGGVKDFVIDEDVVAIGEIGLGGEVRPVSDLDHRIKEGARLGFRRFILSDKCKPGSYPSEIEILRVKDLAGAIRLVSQKA